MRLIDADAVAEAINDEIEIAAEMGTHEASVCKGGLIMGLAYVNTAPTINAVPVETVCEMFGNEAPCNYGLFGVSVDDFMMSKCGKWCEDNCDKVPYTECWRKFFEAIEKWRKND